MGGYRDIKLERYHYLSGFLNGIALLPRDEEGWCSALFLGRWDEEKLKQDLGEFGFLEAWGSQGYVHNVMHVENRVVGCSVFDVMTDIEGALEYLLQMVVWDEYVLIGGRQYHSLSVEHLLLQKAGIQGDKDLFPGQYYAGSGLLRRCFQLLRYWGYQIGAECLCVVPEYFHTAVLFSEVFEYVDGEMQKIFEFYKELLLIQKKYKLTEASKRFEDGQVFDKNNRVYHWPTEAMVYYL